MARLVNSIIDTSIDAVSVNGQIVNLSQPTIQQLTTQPTASKQWSNTMFFDMSNMGGDKKMADTLYGAAEMYRVLYIFDFDIWQRFDDPRVGLFNQSLLKKYLRSFFIGMDESQAETIDQIIIKGLPIFLDSNKKYLPPRTIDVLVSYPPVDDHMDQSVNNALYVGSQYDVVMIERGANVSQQLLGELPHMYKGFFRSIIITG